ncbi:hypothetical protein FYK55_20085 [Roseiconus nitratireducens]|uniref:Uncharacterized protein n=1 Tax=Roseiconus nitratireducens TaxID=2605748 RepID=A0A5M6D024_9BACT|nr:hypothetical protein [Roseiconus nitratireducens]KAA5540693.1 hypothetical protein FYK55_20085 [Roseiconus nitratireducens]
MSSKQRIRIGSGTFGRATAIAAGPKRSGLSIMEVLFAIAVLTIGLLGVASILPVATNNAANAIQIDRSIEEINNRVATDMANLESAFTEVIVANNSLQAFNASSLRFNQLSTQEFGNHLTQYENNLAAGAPAQPQMPDAFCIDPWFLSASNTLRNDLAAAPYDNRNNYDRTVFPCYDPRYQPIDVSPSAALSASMTLDWDTPRFTRIAIPFEGSTGVLSAASAQSTTRRSDDFSVVIPDDTTRGPGLFVQRGGNAAGSLAKNTVSSRYSSIVLMSRSAPGSNLFDGAVVTMRDRQVVTVPGGGAGLAHNLAPYTATDPSVVNGPPPADSELLYPGEQLGYVTLSDRPIVGGGGGEFVFRTSRYVKPELNDGDWLMLMRREYVRDPASGATPTIIPGALKFAWYQVSDVIVAPTLVTVGGVTSYQTQIAVRGRDWVFHPIQQQPFASSYAAPYYGNPTQPSWGNAPAFDYDVMPRTGNPAGYEHQDYGTLVVIVPKVVSVKRFQTQL